ncbi:ATP-binding protein [Streptomyces sp. NPDC020965]|uniref:ATP-binding protein n=1 Tax=Streptomyces sp. NPDC020965 TaxID=3365105 RepID=UPI003791213F
MKQSAAKTLGAAALGAAFAVGAAGAASAEPAALPDSATSLDTITGLVPAQGLLKKLPAGGPETVAGVQAALIESAATLPGTLQTAGQRALAPESPTEVVTALLGGLPVDSLTKGLPAVPKAPAKGLGLA